MDEQSSVLNEANDQEEIDFSELIKKFSNSDIPNIRKYLEERKELINDPDEHGMTLLEHAAYKGSQTLCQLLLDCGASISAGCKNNGYTVLHFAALSGNADLCKFLLEQGANPHVTNSVNRSPAQMAGFVGNHKCSRTINHYIDKADIEYFTEPRGLGKIPIITENNVKTIHNLLTQTNFHPVKIMLLLKQDNYLWDIRAKVRDFIKAYVEREMEKTTDRNELKAMKTHIIGYFFDLAIKGEKEGKSLDDLIKELVRIPPNMTFSKFTDAHLRYAVREFPVKDCTIMHQIVTGLNKHPIGEEEEAWNLISSIINGHKGFKDSEPCATCYEEYGTKQCGRCHYDSYCSKDCQLLHWSYHKKYCRIKAAERQKKLEAEALEDKENDELKKEL